MDKKEYQSKYYLKNKEQKKKQELKRYYNKKEYIKIKRLKEIYKIECYCGAIINNLSYDSHIKQSKHEFNLKNL